MKAQVQWLSPSPLWDELAPKVDKAEFRRPALLRFANDAFMEELQAALRGKPGQVLAAVRALVARPERWDKPGAGLETAPSGDPFKLYQPPHNRFYLVAASLTCRMTGLPDHNARTERGERASFVLRRLRPRPGFTDDDCETHDPQRCEELAWVVQGAVAGWTAVGAAPIAEGEERLPLFSFPFDTPAARRRMFAGLVPVARRQAYAGGPAVARAGGGLAAETAMDPRLVEFGRAVGDPWGLLLQWHDTQTVDDAAEVQATVEQASAYILLDLKTYLATHLSSVWSAIERNDPESVGSSGAQRLLHARLGVLHQALRNVDEYAEELEQADVGTNPPGLPVGYPPFRLTDPGARGLGERADVHVPSQLQALVADALPAPVPAGEPPPSARVPSNPGGDAWHVLRCVYERPACGGGAPPVVSPPSRPFRMASFFDPDAPARPVQVALPVDVNAATLRKYDKGVVFMLSDALVRQIRRVKGLEKLSEGDLAAPSGLGQMCSFSIPIITICALILLMVMVGMLNLIFQWIPFFKVCIPLPGLKAKG